METRTNLPPETPRRKLAFHYDSQGRRTAKTVFTPDTNAQWETASTHHFLYDGWNLLSEISYSPSDSQTNTRWFVWGLDLSGTLQGAGGIGGLLAQISGGTTAPASLFFPAYDANGNISEYISTTGTIAAHYTYDPFGNTIAQTGPQADKLPFRFSTKYTDNETALIYYGYRFYSPQLGRWINREPYGEVLSLNLYSFLFNDPCTDVDVLGFWSLKFNGSWDNKDIDRINNTFKKLEADNRLAMKRLRAIMSAVGKLPEGCAYKKAVQQELTNLHAILSQMRAGFKSKTTLKFYQKNLGKYVDAATEFDLWDNFTGNIYVNNNSAASFTNWSTEHMSKHLFHEMSHVAGVPNDDNSSGWWTDNAHNVDRIANNPSGFSIMELVGFHSYQQGLGDDCCPPLADWIP